MYFQIFHLIKILNLMKVIMDNFQLWIRWISKNYDTNIYEAQLNNDFNFHLTTILQMEEYLQIIDYLLKILIHIQKTHLHLTKIMIMIYLAHF